jgi:hypothetical protein
MRESEQHMTDMEKIMKSAVVKGDVLEIGKESDFGNIPDISSVTSVNISDLPSEGSYNIILIHPNCLNENGLFEKTKELLSEGGYVIAVCSDREECENAKACVSGCGLVFVRETDDPKHVLIFKKESEIRGFTKE